MSHNENQCQTLIFIFLFRRISPATNPIASENLSHNQNEINMKKVKTNAQVTSMVCIIETAVVLFNWITFGLIGSWISLFILYLILLPYFFLMNTSHNKERVIEYGWKNVIWNFIGRKLRVLMNLCEHFGNKDLVHEIFISNTTSKNCDIEKSNCSEDSIKLKTISNSMLDDYPSTSKGQYITKQFDRPPTASDSSGDESYENKTGVSVEVLISQMFKSIHDEKVYIECLKRLIEHLYPSTDQDYRLGSRMTYDNLPNFVSDIHEQRRTIRCKGKQSNGIKTKLDESARFEMILNTDQLECPIIREHVMHEKIHRTSIRDTLLQEIYSNFGDEEKRNLLIEELITEEEKFLA